MTRLNTLLRANGAFSAGSGTLLLMGAGIWDGVFGLDAWFLAVCGVMLAGYGAGLWLAAGAADPLTAGRFASVMDVGWVIAAAIILVLFPTAMTTTGRTALLALSIVVAGLALLQIRALQRPATVAA